MQILLELSFIMDKRKQGIALFITLMVIASIMTIIAVSFSYLEKARENAGMTSAIIQSNLLYKNTTSILKQFFPKGKDNSEKLKLIYKTPLMLSESNSGFSLNLRCTPLLTGVPIAWIKETSDLSQSEKTTLAKATLTEVMELYEIQEPNQLETLILNEFNKDKNQEQMYAPRIHSKKGITSKQQFDRIINNYHLLYDDKKVLLVPWERYFSFLATTRDSKIDSLYLTPEFISIAFDIPVEIVKDSWIIGESTLISFLKENSIITPINKKIYSNKALSAMHCEQTYAYKDRFYKFNFDYIEGRSGNFEFNGKE